MLFSRLKNRGIIRDFDSRKSNGLVSAHRQLFQQLCQAIPNAKSRLCAISSAGPGEGRSTLAINLAAVAARETSAPVLLLDADTESPGLHQPFGLPSAPGLFELIRSDLTLDEAIRPTDIEDVSIISSGERPLGAVALAESEKTSELLNTLRGRFGWVLADTAAILASPGTAKFIRQFDGVVLAVKWSSTRSQLVSQAVDKLDAAQARTLGVVLTQRHFVIPKYVYRRL